MNFPKADDGHVTPRRGDAERAQRQQIAVAVVEHEETFLVGIRPVGVPLAGMSEFPGGKILAGESPAQAAERECREETGLEVIVVGTYSVVEHEYAHGRLTLHFFRCRLGESETAKEPAAPFRWVAREELARLQFPDGNRDVIAEILRNGAL